MTNTTRAPKFTAKKYMGDDIYSWAVFKDGHPIMTGMDQREARLEVKRQIVKYQKRYEN